METKQKREVFAWTIVGLTLIDFIIGFIIDRHSMATGHHLFFEGLMAVVIFVWLCVEIKELSNFKKLSKWWKWKNVIMLVLMVFFIVMCAYSVYEALTGSCLTV